jgi:FlaA1/EpsC-like NDP-sugar epimerase
VISSIESIGWHRFLARPPLPSPSPAAIKAFIRNPILITGAGGSIGSALAFRLASVGARLILLESSESSLFELQSALADFSPNQPPAFFLGRDTERALLDDIFALHRPGLVFHAAAFKHVPLLEEQPFAAISNNIFATQTLATVASAYNSRTVLLSTDKAVAPASVMGATKRVAEQIVLASGGTVLRLGNVLASRGSVAEVFARQIAASLPLTVTDPAARRFFLTLNEAVDQLIAAAAAPAASLYVPDLRISHFIADLARFMASTLAPMRDIDIEFTHPRAGDKEKEQFWSAEETPHPVSDNGLIKIDTPLVSAPEIPRNLYRLRTSVHSRDLSTALSVLSSLVPGYKPSATVLALCAPSAMTNE